ncbi:MAG: hypothetical protein STSR0009_29520 [Methanoregula sp.]
MKEIVLGVWEGLARMPVFFGSAGCGNGGSGVRVERVGDNETGELTYWINRLII